MSALAGIAIAWIFLHSWVLFGKPFDPTPSVLTAFIASLVDVAILAASLLTLPLLATALEKGLGAVALFVTALLPVALPFLVDAGIHSFVYKFYNYAGNIAYGIATLSMLLLLVRILRQGSVSQRSLELSESA